MSSSRPVLEKIISGGQTGVDRAALDVALRFGLDIGGWCPAGRWAEDGPIDARYPLRETETVEPAERTRLNVRDSDGTLILGSMSDSAGTNLTLREAEKLNRPVFTASPLDLDQVEKAFEWVASENIRVLNIAGPRSSENSGIYGFATRFLIGFLDLCRRVKTNQAGHQHGHE